MKANAMRHPILSMMCLPLVIGATWTRAAVVHAATPEVTNRLVAEALFAEGRRAMAEGRIAEACVKFADSNKTLKKLGTLLNLAVCHDKEGKVATAWLEYRAAVTFATELKQPDRAAFAQDQANEVAKRLSFVSFTTASPLEGSKITLEQVQLPASALDLEIPMDPGSYELRVVSPTNTERTVKVEIPPGPAHVKIEIPAEQLHEQPVAAAPSTKSVAPAEPAPAPGSTSSTARTVGYAAILGGGVAVAGSLVVGAVMLGDKAQASCNGLQCTNAGLAHIQSARSAGNVATALLVTGAVLGAGGATLLVIDHRSDSTSTRVGAIGVPGYAGVSIDHTF